MSKKFRNKSTGQVIEVKDEHVAYFRRLARWQEAGDVKTPDRKARATKPKGKATEGTDDDGETDNQQPQNDNPADGGLTESPGEKPGGQKQANTVDKDVNNNTPPQTRRRKSAADNGANKDNSTSDPQ